MAAKYTAKAQRMVLAREGHALSDGSFPIPNVEYLKRAIKLRHNGKNPHAADALIVREAHRLGRPDLIPDDLPGSPVHAAKMMAKSRGM